MCASLFTHMCGFNCMMYVSYASLARLCMMLDSLKYTLCVATIILLSKQIFPIEHVLSNTIVI